MTPQEVGAPNFQVGGPLSSVEVESSYVFSICGRENSYR